MSVRSSLIALAIVLSCPLVAAAQTAPAPPAPMPGQAQPGPHARRHHDGYLTAVRALALTPDQQQQIQAFVRERKAANAGADVPTRRANAKAFRHEVAGILTPDQRAQLRATMAQQRAAAAPPTAPQ